MPTLDHYYIQFADDLPELEIRDDTINGPQTPTSYVVPSTHAAAGTSLTLYGRGCTDYGELIQQNLVNMLENFAGGVSPSYPIQGQLWFKSRQPTGTELAQIGHGHAATDPQATGLYVNVHPTQPGAGNVIIPRVTEWAAIPVSGHVTSDFSMQSAIGARWRIVDLADPQNPYDAINLGYADGRYVNVSGDTMVGDLVMASGNVVQIAAPTVNTHATNKLYVDQTATQAADQAQAQAIDISQQFVQDQAILLTGTTSAPATGGPVVGIIEFDGIGGLRLLGSGEVELQGTGGVHTNLGNITSSYGKVIVGPDPATVGGQEYRIILDSSTGGTITAPKATFTTSVTATEAIVGGLTTTGTINLNSPALTISGTGTLDFGYNVISRITTGPNPEDAVTRGYVDTQLSILGADGVVYDGQVNPTTGEITLNRTIGGDITLSGSVAPYTHNHVSDDVLHYVDPAQPTSFLRSQFINSGSFPDQVTTKEALDVIDGVLSEFTRPYGRQIVISDGVTATHDLLRPCRSGFNHLQVFVDGVKHICDQHAVGGFEFDPQPRSSDDTGLLPSTTYAFSLSVNGGAAVDVEITTPAEVIIGEPPVIRFHDVTQLIDTELATLAIPAVAVLEAGTLLILTQQSGAGSSVTVGAPSSGTDLLTSIIGYTSTSFNDTVTNTFSYKEDALPYQLAESFTFNVVPPTGAVMEFLQLTR